MSQANKSQPSCLSANDTSTMTTTTTPSATTTPITNKNTSMNCKSNPQVPLDVVDDLCSRFIINIPQEERSDLVRCCFHIELAHWFYMDYYCAEQPQLPKCQFREFARLVFNNVPFLQQHAYKVDSVIDKWREYKMAVPTYGAIMLDKAMENVLLVQGFWSKASWGFPKGKVNADEDPLVCAVREVQEETGYDCSSTINSKDYLELRIQDTLIRLYIVTDVERDTIFKPMTRCEIKSCNWFKISELPMSRKDMVIVQNKSVKPNAFFMTIPFIKPLRRWIQGQRRKQTTSFDEELTQAPQNNQRKFWSQTWANIKIDWPELMQEIKGEEPVALGS